MKTIKAGVNTTRVHWVVDELKKLEIMDITVTERFTPYSQISYMEFACNDDKVEVVKNLIHKIGTTGKSVDNYVFVHDYTSLTAGQAGSSAGKAISPVGKANSSAGQKINQVNDNLFFPIK